MSTTEPSKEPDATQKLPKNIDSILLCKYSKILFSNILKIFLEIFISTDV